MKRSSSDTTPSARTVQAAALLILALAGFSPLMAASIPLSVGAVAVLTLLGVATKRWTEPHLRDALVLVFFLYLIGMVPVVGLWPTVGAISLLLTALLAWRRKSLATWREWLRVGNFTPQTWVGFVVIAFLTVAGLLLWINLFGGQLPDVYRNAARSVPTWVAAVGGGAFLILNGVVEDSVFFGVLLTATTRYVNTPVAVVATATVFGLAHYSGVPNGLVGVLLAGSWGLILALLRIRTGGMLATYLAHVVADATIIVVLLPRALA